MKKLLSFLTGCILTAVSFSQTIVYPSGLNVGDKAPQFSALDQAGEIFSLESQLKKGNVVLIFYRGQWCPYCNKQMSELNDSLPMISARGATVLAISPETKENVNKTVAKTRASFPVISDAEMRIMKLYKVNFEVDENIQQKYKGYGIDLMEANGKNGANLPVPATYIIGMDGIIKYVFFNPDYKVRSSVKELLNHL